MPKEYKLKNKTKIIDPRSRTHQWTTTGELLNHHPCQVGSDNFAPIRYTTACRSTEPQTSSSIGKRAKHDWQNVAGLAASAEANSFLPYTSTSWPLYFITSVILTTVLSKMLGETSTVFPYRRLWMLKSHHLTWIMLGLSCNYGKFQAKLPQGSSSISRSSFHQKSPLRHLCIVIEAIIQ